MGQKRGRNRTQEQPNLKRFREDINNLISKQSVSARKEGTSHTFKKQKSRKDKRKEAKKLIKLKRLAYSQHKSVPQSLDELKKASVSEKEDFRKLKKEKIKEKKQNKKKRKQRIKERQEENRLKQVHDDLKQDQKQIKQLEKQLHLNKRKSKNLPKSFLDDGLNYILDVVDKDKVSDLYKDSDISGSEEDFEDEFGAEDIDIEDDMWLRQKRKLKENPQADLRESKTDGENIDRKKVLEQEIMENIEMLRVDPKLLKELINKKKKKKSVHFEDDLHNFKGEDCDNSVNIDEDEEEDASASSSMEDSDMDINTRGEFVEEMDSKENESNVSTMGDSEDKSDDPDEEIMREDIYGRMIDEKGQVIQHSKDKTYIPPGKRLELLGKSSQKDKFLLEKIKRQLKGLVNRVSTSNMGPISSQVETVFLSNSRALVNNTLSLLIMEACICDTMTPEKLSIELIMLATILHSNIGSEVGATLSQDLAEKFNKLWQDKTMQSGRKELDNAIVLFCHLYNFKVLHSTIIFDLMKMFVEDFSQKSIELLILVLKTTGFTLRKDDPVTLKDFIQEIQAKANKTEILQFEDKSRVQFMIDTLLAIKNNNMRKIPNYDPELFEETKKQLRQHIRGSSLGHDQLKIHLEDLISAKDKGRWWIVGSAWEGGSHQDGDHDGQSVADIPLGLFSSQILELARKQRMNTDVRKNIFGIVMTSEDYVDAFEKLLRLGYRNQQEREIIHVILHCSQQEKQYNPYYGYLMQKFCEYHRRFQMTFQFAMWDKFKEMSTISAHKQQLLAKITVHLLSANSISLSMLKVVEFGNLDKYMVRYLKAVLIELLLEKPEVTVLTVFSRIASLSKLRTLCEGLKLFLHHFILRKKVLHSHEEYEKLRAAVILVDKALTPGS